MTTVGDFVAKLPKVKRLTPRERSSLIALLVYDTLRDEAGIHLTAYNHRAATRLARLLDKAGYTRGDP